MAKLPLGKPQGQLGVSRVERLPSAPRLLRKWVRPSSAKADPAGAPGEPKGQHASAKRRDWASVPLATHRGSFAESFGGPPIATWQVKLTASLSGEVEEQVG